MRMLIDTNVFLDFFLNRDFDEADKMFQYCFEKNNQLYITTLSLRDIEYAAHHAVHDKTISKAIQRKAYNLAHKVIGISADAAINSLFSDIDDYEDSLQIEAAKEALLDCIVTNNKKDFKNCGIAVFTPKELNEIWSKQ